MIDNSACWWKCHTRRKGHVQSRQDQLPPEHHGFSAQGSRRPQWARPWPRRHMSGPVWHQQRREREQQREPTSDGKILLATAQLHENAPKQLQSPIEMPYNPSRIELGLNWSSGWWNGLMKKNYTYRLVTVGSGWNGLGRPGKGLYSPKRVCQRRRQRPRSGWIAAKRS